MSLFRRACALTGSTLLSLAAAAALPAAAAPPDTAVVAGAARAQAASPPAADSPPAPKRLFTIRDDRVTESSGLAKSQKHAGIWWTVNDSGDRARIFAVNKEGDVVAVLTFKDTVRDIEAISVGRDGTIYVADIGDNRSVRDYIAVYTITEPEDLKDQQVRYHRFDFEYPDGAHDAETLLIHPETQRMYFVTKVRTGKGAFYAAPKEPSKVGTNELERLASAPANVTDGTFLPDSRRVVLRTDFGIEALTWGPKPAVYARSNTPLAQGESVAVGPTGSTVVVGSEGENSVVYQMQIPAKKPATASTAAPKPAAADAGKNHNLRSILLGAGIFALVVAIVTFPAGRRRHPEEPRLEAPRPIDRTRRRSTV